MFSYYNNQTLCFVRHGAFKILLNNYNFYSVCAINEIYIVFTNRNSITTITIIGCNCILLMKLTSGGRGAKGAPGGRPGGGGGAPFWYGYPTGRAGSPGCRGKPGG